MARLCHELLKNNLTLNCLEEIFKREFWLSRPLLEGNKHVLGPLYVLTYYQSVLVAQTLASKQPELVSGHVMRNQTHATCWWYLGQNHVFNPIISR